MHKRLDPFNYCANDTSKFYPLNVKTDKEGFTYVKFGQEVYRITKCCRAIAASDELGIVHCNECTKAVDFRYALDPVLKTPKTP